jgi:hypothetical protein
VSPTLQRTQIGSRALDLSLKDSNGTAWRSHTRQLQLVVQQHSSRVLQHCDCALPPPWRRQVLLLCAQQQTPLSLLTVTQPSVAAVMAPQFVWQVQSKVR